MTRPVAALAAVALCLALPAAAAAKEVVGVRVCGPRGCVDRTAMLRRAGVLETILTAQPAATPARPGGAFVRVRVDIGERRGGRVFGTTRSRFIPRLALMDGPEGFWSLPDHATVTALRRAARGVGRYPARGLQLPPPSPPARTATPAPRPRVRDAGLSPAVPGAAVALAAAALLLLRRRRRV